MTTTAPSINDHYAAYRKNPSQENLTRVVTALKPTIDYSLAAVGSSGDPLVRSKALIYTAQAIRKHNPDHPGAASLPTFVASQLRQLSRTARQSKTVIKQPERIQIDAYQLSQASKKFEEEHGREGDLIELADYSGLPLKRIEKIKKFAVAIPSETAMGPDSEKEGTDWQTEAMDYIYHDADHVDRKILEHKTGYGGSPILTPQELCIKLGLTPSQLSRRSAKLSLKINSTQAALESI